MGKQNNLYFTAVDIKWSLVYNRVTISDEKMTKDIIIENCLSLKTKNGGGGENAGGEHAGEH